MENFFIEHEGKRVVLDPDTLVITINGEYEEQLPSWTELNEAIECLREYAYGNSDISDST